MGEGAFIFRLGGASRHGEVLGVAASSASVPVNAWPSCPEPLVRTMRLAIEDAGIEPADVSVVYASANATSLDDVEARAIAETFAGCQPVVTSIKGALGECGASGTASCAAAFLCGSEGKVPPIAGLETPSESASALRLAREVMPAGPIALVNSFASGGALFSAVLRVNAGV
jgi:3-oxoacyl-(acyl-carrier-protein) synthase